MSDSGKMSSLSAQASNERPFYADHADAYDLLITDPVEPWVDAVHDKLVRAGRPQATILDAGCGTGRHAAALIAEGHPVDLADAAEHLLAKARLRCPSSRAYLADLCTLRTLTTYEAVTCRGVLNDMVTDEERSAAIHSLAKTVVPGGLLLLDLREQTASRVRADGVTRARTVTLSPVTTLTFTTRTTWESGLLRVQEQYQVTGANPRAYEFTMRPWSTVELTGRLRAAGLTKFEIRPGLGRKTPDRLFVCVTTPHEE
jgi:2-polyprenyl-3-methyl-5-hydroxy-6-metoxy-1,4-benzoquinol methylase